MKDSRKARRRASPTRSGVLPFPIERVHADIPTVLAVARGAFLIITCPFCGQMHTHGRGYGHRWSHCADGRDTPGYVLAPTEVNRVGA
jgi:hypothetical protein